MPAPQTFTIPRTTFAVGTTVLGQTLSGAQINTLAVSCDITAWTLPGTLSIGLEASLDHGVTWRGAGGCYRNEPPGAGDDGGPATATGFSETFSAFAPTNARWTIIVTGSPIPLGPSTITIS